VAEKLQDGAGAENSSGPLTCGFVHAAVIV
jgi:hypothetical protein